MLTLINANRMNPPIAPIGLDYVATAARATGVESEVLDLGLALDPLNSLREYFEHAQPRLIGITFRNVDDCFWPSGTSFLPELVDLVSTLRRLTDAPIVLGGVGFSIFGARIVEATGADFGVCGDGEEAAPRLYHEVGRGHDYANVPGLVWRDRSRMVTNPPAWPGGLQVPATRNAIDNRTYFQRGGQVGVETKRGCPRKCIYCADPLAKGTRVRERSPAEIADEFAALADQGVEVIHLCDGEFNVPRAHALAVCRELAARGLAGRVRWYTYATVTPFDAELARAARTAGCVGINFTSDAGADAMLARYAHPHRRTDLETAVGACREQGIRCMLDLLLGGPGETPETIAESIAFLKQIDPDCAGASLGMRLYPGTPVAAELRRRGILESGAGILRKYAGPVDLLHPTFYIAPALGDRPAQLVRELIGDDPRFFPPAAEPTEGHADGDHNYNDNAPLVAAIADGARGAYWDILRSLRAS